MDHHAASLSRRRRGRRAAALGAVAVGVLDLLVVAAGEHHGVRRPTIVAEVVGTLTGPRYLPLVAGLALIWCHRGLRRGTHMAWLVALAGAVLSILGGHVERVLDVIAVVAAAVLLAALAGAHTVFQARAEPSRVRDGLRLLIVGLGVLLVYAAVGLYQLDDHFQDATTLAQSVREAVRLLVLLPTSTIEPVTRHGEFFLDSVRFGTLVVVLTSVAWMVEIVAFGRRRTDEAAVRQLLEQWGRGPLDFFLLLDDKTWHVGADGRAFVGYTVVGHTAIALGDPVGDPASVPAVLAEFIDLCDRNGWAPAIHQLSPEGAVLARRAGLRTLKIGEEAIIDLRHWTLEGSDNKWLRSALRRVDRAGLEFVELSQPLSDEDLSELRRVSERWLADGEHRERTFTVGRFDPTYLRSTRVFAIRNRQSGQLAAFANVVPSYRGPNGNFDLMRRDPGAPNGVMDALFVGLIEMFAKEGLDGMTIGLAPMTQITGDGIAPRAMRLAYERGERVFNYQGLRRFKEKWAPRWEPRYLAYAGESVLLRTAIDVARAGELRHPARFGRLARLVRRLPVTIGVCSVVLWLMSSSAVDRGMHRTLLRHLAVHRRDLFGLQVWRLPSAQLIQPTIGLTPLLLVALVTTLSLGELHLGSGSTAAVFFGGGTMWWLGALLAAHSRAAPYCGSAPGMFAVVGALAVSFGGRWWRDKAGVGKRP